MTRFRLILQEFHLLGGQLPGVAVETFLSLLGLLVGLLEGAVLMSRHSALRLIVEINLGAVPSGILTSGLLPGQEAAGVNRVASRLPRRRDFGWLR